MTPDSAVIPDAARRVVDEQRLGFVATISELGWPNVSPKGTVSVWSGSQLIFADLASPNTIANLERNNRVEVNVVDPILRKGWRFRGTGRVFRTGPVFDQAVQFFQSRNLPDAPRRIRTIVVIEVERALPLVSPAYAAGFTEDLLRQRWLKRYQLLNSGSGITPGKETELS